MAEMDMECGIEVGWPGVEVLSTLFVFSSSFFLTTHHRLGN